MGIRDRELVEVKRALRPELLRRRAGIPAANRAACSSLIESRVLALPEVAAASSVFCFISHGPEVHTHGILDGLLARGKTVLVPKIPRGEPMRAVRFGDWSELAPGTLGIPAPVRSDAWNGRVDVVITPGLAFTPDGVRIGYGRGYYDQWFAAHAHGLRAGVAFGIQVLPGIPAGSDDVRVHMLVTERDCIRCSDAWDAPGTG